MNPYYELPSLGKNYPRAHVVRHGRPNRQIKGVASVGAQRLVNGLNSAFRRSVRGISSWRRRRTAMLELQALNDRYLKDIGLDRSRIGEFTDHP